jgi:hypothetical protein
MDSNRYLRRSEASAALREKLGVTLAEATLAKMCCYRTGPPVEFFGRVPLYREDRLLAWARSRIGAQPSPLSVHTIPAAA